MSNYIERDVGFDILPPPTTTVRTSTRSFRRKTLASDAILTDDQIDLVLNDLAEVETPSFLSTSLGKQTWSRYLVENYLQHYKWYNPNRDNPAAPKLSKGWAYFEHFTLPRRFDQKSGGANMRAPPGENVKDTSLYGFFTTPMDSLSDWGIGMGMYFSSLSAVFVIFILAGSLNVYNMVYYASPKYDPKTETTLWALLNILKFSAVCTDREWVICDGCDGVKSMKYWETLFANEYYGEAKNNNGESVILINKTTCDPATLNNGMVNYATLMFLILCMWLYMWYLKKREVRFDEDNSSAQDYSLIVHNPPPDALDPDEWRDFFDKFADKGVTLVTVALNNEMLLKQLMKRRKDMKLLKRCLPPELELDVDDVGAVDIAVGNAKRYRLEEERQRSCCSKLISCLCLPFRLTLKLLGLSSPVEDVIWKRIKKTTEKIKLLHKKEYNAAAVYVTFETEEGQRTALEALDVSEMQVMANTAMNMDSSSLFQGKVLRVTEASEPDTVRWTDLDYSRMDKNCRILITFGITCGLVGCSALILYDARFRVNTTLYAIILTMFNTIVPIIVRLLVSIFEKHYNEGSVQASLYLKITFFRWVNTAIITRMITPFLVTLGQEKIDLINTVNALMLSEMVLSPLLRYLDFFTILKRHYFAPRSKTEEELFSCFSGGWYNLGERYTDFTKVLLLCTFYSTFHPLAYFLGAAILFLQYWMDKFLLLRSWQRAPLVGPETARFSRTYFNTAAILLGAITSGYAYAQSPFTNLCSCAENSHKECPAQEQFAFSNVTLLNNETEATVTASNELFYFCEQKVNDFPPIPTIQGKDKWMTADQESLTWIYGYTCLVLLILYVVVVLGQRIFSTLKSQAMGVYKPHGISQHKDFSSGIGFDSFGYIPQLEVSGFHFPLLICNIDDIDVKLIGWKDPNCRGNMDEHRNYDNHNLIFDVPHDNLHRSRNVAVDQSKPRRGGKDRPIFSVVKHYPPAWALRARENNQS